MKTPKIIIIGTGIAGLSIARGLAILGCSPIIIIAHSKLSHGYTTSGAGIISAQFWDEKPCQFALRTLEIVNELAKKTRLDLHQCGMAQIATSESKAKILDKLCLVRKNVGKPLAELPRFFKEKLSRKFVNKIVKGTFSADDLWVNPQQLLNSMLKCIPKLTMIEESVLEIKDGLAVTEKQKIKADKIVICTGVWSRNFKVRLKTISSTIVRTYLSFPSMLHVLDSGLYLRPDGKSKVIAGDGDSVWKGSLDKCDVNPASESAICSKLENLFDKKTKPITSHAGLVAMTRDQHPIAKPTDQNRKIWVFTGLGGDGLALGPSLGEALASQILDKPTHETLDGSTALLPYL